MFSPLNSFLKSIPPHSFLPLQTCCNHFFSCLLLHSFFLSYSSCASLSCLVVLSFRFLFSTTAPLYLFLVSSAGARCQHFICLLLHPSQLSSADFFHLPLCSFLPSLPLISLLRYHVTSQIVALLVVGNIGRTARTMAQYQTQHLKCFLYGFICFVVAQLALNRASNWYCFCLLPQQ